MKQIRRLLALVLDIAIVLALIPAQALAANAGQQTGGGPDNQTSSHIFTDVREGDWFFDAVEYVVDHGLFQGTSATAFEPDGSMSRGIMVTVLGRMDQANPDEYAGASRFTDVAADIWYASWVNWAAEHGITEGVSRELFAPNTPITRAQMATFLWRYFRYAGARLSETVTDTLPSDYDDIPDYAREAAEAMWRCGVFQGSGDGRFEPNRQLTRAEAAALLWRVDTHLVGIGAKEYPDDQEEESGPSPSYPGGYDPSTPAGEVLYTPDSSDNQTIAAQQDVATSFSITVISSNTSLTADQVKDLITATDLSTLDEDGSAVTGCIQVSGGNGTYTITGTRPGYEVNGAPVPGFAPGHSYKIVLNDDRLTFDGQAASVREYDFTVARQEEMNLELADGMKYIPAGEISNIIVNGDPVESLDMALVSVGQDGIVQNASEDTEGSFTYTGDPMLEPGDIVAVYEGTHPKERGTENTAEDSGVISYVKITEVEDTTCFFEGAKMEEVVETPDVFPLSDTYLDNDNTIEVPASAFVYSGDLYTEMGLDGSAQVDVGDYLAFYSGYLDPAAAKKEDFAAEPELYAKITGVRQGEKNTYILSYVEVTLADIQSSMSTYVENDVDMGATLSEEDIKNLEDGLEAQAQESGFARAAAEELAWMAMQADSLEQARRELGMTSMTYTGNAQALATRGGIQALAAAGGGQQQKVEIKLGQVGAKVSTTLEHFSGMKGLRVELNIPFTLTINLGDGKIVMKFDPTFIQELRVSLSASVDVIWDNFIYIVWWIDEFEVTANVDLYTFTDIDIDINVTSDDGQTDITEVIDKIKDLVNGGGDEKEAETLAERYQAMLKNTSEWVDLFAKRLYRVKQNLAKVITIYLEIEYVVSANVNVYIGLDFTHEMARRYIFTIQVFSGKGTSDTITLVPEEYTLDVYIMGKIGLRTGIRLTVGVSLIHKKVACVELSAEVGPYVELYGYFYYHLYHHEDTGTTSQAAGAMYVEIGLYVDTSANLSAFGGLLSWNPEIYSETFPLWSAGNRNPVISVDESQTFPAISFNFANPGCLSNAPPRMTSMDLLTGKTTTRTYGWDEFEIITTNDAVWYDDTYHVLWAKQPLSELDVTEKGQVLITWKGDNGCLAFNTQPIRHTIDFTWNKIYPEGYRIHLITGMDSPSWIEYAGEYGSAVNYDKPTCHSAGEPTESFNLKDILNSREWYEFDGWLDAKGNRVEKLPDTMPHSDTQTTTYYAQWKEAIPYTVNLYYEVLEEKPADTSNMVQRLGKWYELKKTETGTGEKGVDICVSRVFEDYTQTVTEVLGDPRATLACERPFRLTPGAENVLDCYFDRGRYRAEFQYFGAGGEYIASYADLVKVGALIQTPDIVPPAGYSLGQWTGLSSTMPTDDKVFTNKLTANTNTPYTVEHYVQQYDTTYKLEQTTTKYGTTGELVTIENTDLLTPADCQAGTYDIAEVRINGDGSTVVKVRYARTKFITATFHDTKGRILRRDYAEAGKPIVPPELEMPDGSEVLWYYLEGNQKVYGIPTKMPNQNTDFYAYLTEGEQATYTVEHYVQDAVGGEYELVKTDEGLLGTVGEAPAVTLLTGYDDSNQFKPDWNKDTTVDSDGSTVIWVYYNRVKHDLTYDLNPGDTGVTVGFTDTAFTGTVSVRYGAPLTDLLDNSDVAHSSGLVLMGWNTSADGKGETYTVQTTMPDRDVTLYAQWTDGYVITVNHHQEKADHGEYDERYELYETETIVVPLVESTGSYTPAVKEYAHFTKPASQTVTFTEEEKAYTVDYKYDRETYQLTVTYTASAYSETTGKVTPAETATTTIASVRYGQTLKTAFDGMKEDYDFDEGGRYSLNFGYVLSGFTDESGQSHTTMPARDLKVEAQWTADVFEIYFANVARLDVLAALQKAGIKTEFNRSPGEIRLYLTYGEEQILPKAEGLCGIQLRLSDDQTELICGVGEDLASTKMYVKTAAGNLSLAWEKSGIGTTAENPIVIYDGVTLDQMVEGTYYKLGADLDFAYCTYAPPASGVFHLDGDSHTISNLTLRASAGHSEFGLFEWLEDGSTVSNLTLKDQQVTDTYLDLASAGSLAGKVSGNVTIENVTVTGAYIELTDTTKAPIYSIGGLVGRATEGATLTLKGCSVSGVTTIKGGTMDAVKKGAFVGYTEAGASVSISDCTNGTDPKWEDIGGSAGTTESPAANGGLTGGETAAPPPDPEDGGGSAEDSGGTGEDVPTDSGAAGDPSGEASGDPSASGDPAPAADGTDAG